VKDLPIVSSFRIPSRFTLLVPLVGAICAAFAFRALEGSSANRPSNRSLRAFIWIASVVAIGQLVLVNRAHLKDAFVLPALADARLFERPTPRIDERELASPGPPGVERTNMLGSMLDGVAPLLCYEPLQVKKVARTGPTAIEAPERVTLTAHAFSPNRIAARAAVGPEPARLVLNQNFAAGWSVNAGRLERDPGSGRPATVLPAGFNGEVAFSYAPPGLAAGVTIWLVAIAGSVVVWRKRAR
jgi:hypothetical protein